ncbi:hypothetical protein PCH_Pc19g00150 [Penicillium rubens Wisconsin 54-1255]|uniref:Uncharacterized protein n=1 Tax=Penicillium rubens (strain ATCC 28089 / DSM 1075 / NRRL 1951 / Wisconsin 54-1255) TaxID=500485 RepID=B6HD10_PENRW|nr:hypothetical protein PCH_Pc19g00150 [Penicillium rubens Wisconsin 54-1255]
MDVPNFHAANFAIGCYTLLLALSFELFTLPRACCVIGEIIHDSHGRAAKTTDEETAKSCSPCARALWSNVLGSIEIASTSGSVELQTGQAKIHISAAWIVAFLPWEYAEAGAAFAFRCSAGGTGKSGVRKRDAESTAESEVTVGWMCGCSTRQPLNLRHTFETFNEDERGV